MTTRNKEGSDPTDQIGKLVPPQVLAQVSHHDTQALGIQLLSITTKEHPVRECRSTCNRPMILY